MQNYPGQLVEESLVRDLPLCGLYLLIITRPNCDLMDSNTFLCLDVPGFHRQVFKQVFVGTIKEI